MATAPKAPPITCEQYERFEGYPGLRDELIFGEIVLSPQPKPLHQEIARTIEIVLNQLLQNTAYVARQNSNIKFRGIYSMPAPDVFVVPTEEWFRACENDDYIEMPPLLVVEVLSAANRRKRVAQKVELYLQCAVQQVWVVAPKTKTITIHTSASPQGEIAGSAIELPPPFASGFATDGIFDLRRRPAP